MGNAGYSGVGTGIESRGLGMMNRDALLKLVRD